MINNDYFLEKYDDCLYLLNEKLLLNFNKNRYRELLKLEELNALDSNAETELDEYDGIFLAQNTWELRDQYLTLLNGFCLDEINTLQFRGILNNLNDLAQEITNICRAKFFITSPYSNCLKFEMIISFIQVDCYEMEGNELQEYVKEELLALTCLVENEQVPDDNLKRNMNSDAEFNTNNSNDE